MRFAEALLPGDDDVARADKAQNLAGDFLHEVRVGLVGRKESDVALKLGASEGGRALVQARAVDDDAASAELIVRVAERGSHLEAVPAIDCMMNEVGRQTQAEKQHRRLPWPRASIMDVWLTQHRGYAAQLVDPLVMPRGA